MCGRHRDRTAREAERGLDQARPGQSAVLVPERVEPCRNSRHPARADSDRVVHELRAERNVQLQERHLSRLGAEPRDGDEAVEVPRAARRRVEVDPVPASEQARHHRLRDARGEGRGNRGVGRASAVLEDFRARLRSRRMAGGDARSHDGKGKGPPAATAPCTTTYPLSGTARRRRASVPILGGMRPATYACTLLMVLFLAGCHGSKKKSLFGAAGRVPASSVRPLQRAQLRSMPGPSARDTRSSSSSTLRRRRAARRFTAAR